MKIAVCSDLHLEFGDLDLQNDEAADVLILSGDIFIASELLYSDDKTAALVPAIEHVAERGKRYYNFIKQCCDRFSEVVMVSGNHEHYHGDFATTHDTIRKTFADLENFNYLDKDFLIIKGVIFYGGTLWTDMNKEDPVTMYEIRNKMNDYVQIKYTSSHTGGSFYPQDTVEDHYAFRRGLDEVLENYPMHEVVVVGHHAPSTASTHPRYTDENIINYAYSTNLNNFILDRRQIKLWTHGHTHEPFDYMIGTTRVVCNPRGYDSYEDRADNFKLKYLEI
jgi:Icc-related predicted phosphoesterase